MYIAKTYCKYSREAVFFKLICECDNVRTSDEGVLSFCFTESEIYERYKFTSAQ